MKIVQVRELERQGIEISPNGDLDINLILEEGEIGDDSKKKKKKLKVRPFKLYCFSISVSDPLFFVCQGSNKRYAIGSQFTKKK